MTLDELNLWIKGSKYVTSQDDYDGNGNNWAWKVFERDGQLYRIDYCNKHPCPERDEKGYVLRGRYEPRKVTKKTEMIEHVTYE